MQLDTDRENAHTQKNLVPSRYPKYNKKSRLKNSKSLDTDLYWKPNHSFSEHDGCYRTVTSDVWYAQNADFLTKHESNNVHDCSVVDYPIYRDLKNADTSADNVYLLPLTGTKFQPADPEKDAPRKKGLFKNLKAALFAKKNGKRPKPKRTFNLPIINVSTAYNNPVYNRPLTVNNLRSSYSLDSLNVIENTIVWRELANKNGLTSKAKHIESDYPKHRTRHHSGSDILADVLSNNEISNHLAHQDHLRVTNSGVSNHLAHQNHLRVTNSEINDYLTHQAHFSVTNNEVSNHLAHQDHLRVTNNGVSNHLTHQDHLSVTNNVINDHLTHEDLTQQIIARPDTPTTITKNGVPVFVRTQKDLGDMSESQGDMFFDEETLDPLQIHETPIFHYTKRQDKKIIPRYPKQQLDTTDGVVGRYNANVGSYSTLPNLKNSLSSSASSARSSASSAAQMQDERTLLSLSCLNLNSCQSQQDLLNRHFRTLDRNPRPQRRYLQAQNNRCGQQQQQQQQHNHQQQQQHTNINQCLSGSGVSVESIDSGLGSYSDSYLAKVKRSVHFNGSDEIFEYIPVNSGVYRQQHQQQQQQQRTRQGTMAVRNHGRKPKMASYL